jgi:hypothetical protein
MKNPAVQRAGFALPPDTAGIIVPPPGNKMILFDFQPDTSDTMPR